MGSPDVGDDRGIEFGGVVRAENFSVGSREREVDERLVPGGFPQFSGAARAPDRLAHIPYVPPRMAADEREHPGNDPRGIAAHPAHIRELDNSRIGAERVPDEADLGGGDRGEGWFTRGQTVAEEPGHRGGVVGFGPVEEADMPEGAGYRR